MILIVGKAMLSIGCRDQDLTATLVCAYRVLSTVGNYRGNVSLSRHRTDFIRNRSSVSACRYGKYTRKCYGKCDKRSKKYYLPFFISFSPVFVSRLVSCRLAYIDYSIVLVFLFAVH